MTALSRLSVLLVALALLACHAAQRARPLPDEGPVERWLEPGATHRYVVRSDAGRFLSLFLEQEGVDLTARLEDPAGEVLAVAGGPANPHGRRLVVAITERPGRHLLTVAARNAGDSGPYVLGRLQDRPVQPGDDELALALRSFAAGKLHNRRHAPVESRRMALDSFSAAARHFAAAGDASGEAWALALAADVHLNLEDWTAARDLSRRALRIFDATETGSPDGRCTAMTALARALGRLQRVDRALATFDRALTECPDPRGQGFNLLNRGDLYLQIQQPEKAWRDFERARQVWQSAPGEDRSWLITTLINLGLADHELGRLEQAFHRYREAEELIRNVGTVQDEIHLYTNLGHYYIAVGELQKALDNLERGLQLARQRQLGIAEQAIGHSLAVLYRILGRPREAASLYRRSLRVGRELGDAAGVAEGLLALAQLAWEEGRPEEALERLEAALAEARRGHNPAVEADVLRQTGVYLTLSGDPREGLERIRHGKELATNAPPSLRSALRRAEAAALQALNRPAEARAELLPALELDLALDNPLERVEVNVALAAVEQRLGRPEAAQRRLEEALDLQETVRATVTDPELRASFLARRHDLYLDLIQLLMSRAERHPDADFTARALAVSERARGRTLVEMLSEARTAIEQGVSDEVRRRERSLWTRYALLQSEAGKAAAEGDPVRVTLRRALERVHAEIRSFEEEVQRDFSEYASLRYPRPLDPTAIRELLPAGTALLHYVLDDERSFAFVVTGDGIRARELAGRGEIDPRVEALRRVLGRSDPRSVQVRRRICRELYRLLVAPVAAELTTATDLWIVPDGTLFYLPFEALLGDGAALSEDRPLIALWSVSYSPSATVLTRLAAGGEAPGRNTFVAFAGPDIAPSAGAEREEAGRARDGRRLRALPGTVDEVRSISRIFPRRSALYLGRDANQDNLFGNPAVASAHWLHFATHGIIREEEPTRSALLLSPDSRGDDQLQVGEIFNLRLGAAVVVLSACETGLGDEVRGEGLIGLSRAFFYAGATNVLVSLQPVSDEGTPELMRRFYCELAGGRPPGRALRAAKLAMLRHPLYNQPRFWAPFVLFGTADRGTPVVTSGRACPPESSTSQ